MIKRHSKKIFDVNDDLTSYTHDDWSEVSEDVLPYDVLITYYNKIDWALYAMHTDISTLNLPMNIRYSIHDDVYKGSEIRKVLENI